MSFLIFSLHVSIVFFIPAWFGWIVLRRVVQEHDLAVLVPGSVVMGFVALMALVNELRYWLEMPQALWFSYKALLLLGLVIVLATDRPRWHPGLARSLQGGWKLGWVVAGAILTGFYFGIPAFRGLLNDAWWGHYPLAVEIQTASRFPLNHPFAVDDPLYYHIGPDILASGMSFLLLLPVQQGYALEIAFMAPAAFLLAFALVRKLSRDYFSALAAAAFVVVGGNLRFLDIVGYGWGNPAARLRIFNSQTVQGLIQMMFTPSHCVGIPVALLILVIFRHFLARPTWRLAAVLGLSLGIVTLVAEWYFFPLWVALALCLWMRKRQLHRCAMRPNRLSSRGVILFAPLIIAVGVALYNGSYTAGFFNYFWTHSQNVYERAGSRQILARIEHRLPPPTWEGIAEFERLMESKWSPPPLVPLKLNIAHLGEVPSWEGAGSDGGSWVPIWSWSFLSEVIPVVGLGIPFGIWWYRRSPNLTLLAVLLLAGVSLVPPIFLDWGYRSTDLLRFMTGAFSFSALLAGCLGGHLWRQARWKSRSVGMVLVAIVMINSVALGVLGLMPSTLATAETVGSLGISLSQMAGKKPDAEAKWASDPEHERAFTSLARQLDDFLFPLTGGRDRALVIVSPSQIPPLAVFPEWMKLATLSRIRIPIGWHWNDSLYAACYRNAVSNLDADAVASLGVHWVIVTNIWDFDPPAAVTQALQDPSRFVLAMTLRSGPYRLILYRAF